MSKEKTNKMENIVIFGEITNTSKNQSEDFKQENPTKTAYLKVGETVAKQLEEFGLQKYTSKEDKSDFFIVKFVAKLMCYKGLDDNSEVEDWSDVAGLETNNFKTVDGQPIMMNIIKGNHKNNDFFRIQALMVEDNNQLEELKPTNPFAQ